LRRRGQLLEPIAGSRASCWVERGCFISRNNYCFGGIDRNIPSPKIVSEGQVIMSLVNLVVILIAVGVLLWLVNTYIPMDGKIKNILNAVVVIGVVIWLLQVFGVLGSLNGIHVGH
jgi:hypothetical protein